MNQKFIEILLLIFAVTIIITSYGFSDQTAQQSISISDQVLEALKLVTHDEVVNETGKYPLYSRIIREVAHLVLYAFIALPIFLLTFMRTKRIWASIIITYLLLICYAYFDEFHQEGVDGRGYEWLDLVLDFIGGSLVILVGSISLWIGRKFASKKYR